MGNALNEKPYRPKVTAQPYRPDFFVEKDFDYANGYPCGVCGNTFNSRTLLATHSHRKGASG